MTASDKDNASSEDTIKQRKDQLTEERLRLLELLEKNRQAGFKPDTQTEQTAVHAASPSAAENIFAYQTNAAAGFNPWQPFAGMGYSPQAASQLAGQLQNAPGGGGNIPPLTPLIAMKKSGSRSPFFCVHAVFGSAFPYFHLALHMEKEQPFYGIQSPGLDGKQSPLETIEAMASRYIQEIKSVQKQGPYHLGGYSFGSWIAFEIAQQLRRMGEKTGLLAMIGTGTPISMSNPQLFEQLEFIMQYCDDFNKLVVNSMLSDEARLALNQQQQQTAGNPQQAQLSPLNQVMQANNRAQLRYVPRPYPGKVTVFMTLEQQAAYPMDPSMGWKMLSTEAVESIQVSGTHLNMFYEPHVSDLAQKLNRCLRQAQQEAAR